MSTLHHTSPVRSARPSALAVATLLAAMASAANAQTTINWTTTSPAGDSGTWSDTAKWGGGNVPDSNTESAVFGAYANNRTITLDGAYSINALTITPRDSGFAGKTFSLQLPGSPAGSEKLLIGSGGVTLGGGTSVNVSVPLELTADQVWTTANESNQASATFSGVISGAGKLTRTANGSTTQGSVITFSGANTFSGGFTQNAAINTTRLGSSSVVSGGVIQSGALGTGTVTLNAGVLSASSARTISNNVVLGGNMTFGESGNTGTLTFSDANLTAPTTFTLGSANNGAITRIRTANTSLTFDQAIAESGGNGQSILFASTNGTPTVTLNRTKTATGNIIAGGVALVLNNGSTANSGATVAVNGSVTANSSNKFSSGGVISDGATLAATDATNFSAVQNGGVTVYNNARVSFGAAPTQAQAAALFSSDSQLRLGLGSGSGNLSVSENYNQAQLGNGKAGLVSGTTGTLTYTGTLGAGSDNTYRVGGGLGTLALGSSLGGENALRVEGGGNVTTSVNHGYTGATTLVGPGGYTGAASFTGGLTTLSGAGGAFSGTSGITLNSGAVLNIETGGTGNNRINNSASVTLNSGYLLFNNAASTAAFSETMGNLAVNGGANQINFRTAPASGVRTVQFGDISRANNAVLLVRGDALGGTASARNEIKFTNTPTLVGGGGAAGTTTQSIVPWMRGVFDGTLTSGPGRFVTYDTNGLRTLNPNTEMVQANSTTKIDQAISAAGGGSTFNIRWNPNAASGSQVLSGTTATVNSLWIGNSGSTAANSYGLNGGTINVTSGVVHFQHDITQNMTVNNGTLAFGSTEAIITSNSGGGFLTTLGATLTGSGGVSVYALSGGGISLGSVTNNISGTFTFGGNGFIAVDNDTRFGNAANSVVHGGGELRFFAGLTTTRALTLLGNVGDNVFGNNHASQTVTWNGNITGEGRLRLINNNGANGANGFALGGANDYSGGTQIEGVNVTGSSNTALGTGTVTLQGANNNPAALTLTGAAPALGGLRGTDGTVTINPSAASATLTVGANNENTVFNGVIAQGSGKTGSLTKTGAGHLVLGGASTFTGPTTVAQGKLSVIGSLASQVAVDTGGTLGGTGVISGLVTVRDGGTLAPGNSPGLLTLNSGLTLNENSTFAWELAANTDAGRGTAFDGVNISSGTLTIGAGATASLAFNSPGSTVNWTDSFWASDHQWLVFSNVSSPSITSALIFDSTTLSVDSIGSTLASIRPAAGFSWSADNNNIYLSYAVTAIPEPSAFAAFAGLGALGLASLRRRRRA